MAANDPKSTCGAKNRQGKPCRLPAGHGTDHVGTGRCSRHGGASPKAQVAGAVELARRDMQVMGRPLDIEPHRAILQCIGIAAGEVQYASERIAELDPSEAVGPVLTEHERPLKFEKGAESQTETVTERKREAPALHIWIKARHDAMDRLVTYSKVAIAAGIAERQVRVAEQQGQLFAGALRRILTALGVADHPEAPSVVRRELTLIAGGAQQRAA